MIRNFLPFIMFFLFTANLYSLQVDVTEIKTNKNVEFINYTGKHDYIETFFDIKGIGYGLASGLKEINIPFNYFMKYSVIQAVDDSSSDKLNAVIFSIDKEARVDHIKNIRLIIAAFLERKYGYSVKDSETLAYYVTIYNAIYRGNMDYLGTKYKPIVTGHMNAQIAGISTKYYEWPGLSKIIIPLTDNPKKGNMSSLDTTILTDKNVKDQVKKDKEGDKQQQNVITIKEKEVEQKTKEIDKQQKTVDKQKEDIKKEETKLDQKKEDLIKKEDQLKQDLEKAKTDEEKKKIEEELAKVEKEKEQLKTDETKIAEKKDEVKKEEANIETKKEEVVKKQEEIKNDKTDANNTKTELEKKQEELDKREQALKESKSDENMFGNRLYYLKIKEYLVEGHYNNEMYLIGAESKKVEVKSELSTICGHKFDVSDNGVVVIAHQGQHSAPHNLVLLDKDTLKVKIKGTEDIFWRSFVETREGMIYAVVKKSDTEFYLGKFNNKLEMVAVSKEKIDSNTFISFYENSIFINNPDKEIIVLNKNDLAFVEKIKP